MLSGEQITQIEVTIIKACPQKEILPNSRRLPLPPLLKSADKRRAWMFGQAQGTQSILQGLDRLTKHLKPITTPNHRGNDSHHIKGTQYLRVPHNIIEMYVSLGITFLGYKGISCIVRVSPGASH